MTAAVPTAFASVSEMFELQAARTPEAVALRCGARSISYAELNRRANELAAYLAVRGVTTETVVGLWMDRSIEMVVCALAIWKSTATYVPIDPGHSKADRVRQVLERTGAGAVLTHAALAEELTGFSGERILVDAAADEIARMPAADPPRRNRAEALAAIMFTSGTTASVADRTAVQRLKGVLLTHENLAHFACTMARELELQPADVYLHTASLSFVTSLRQLLVPLCCGATVVIATRDHIRDPLELFRELARCGVTILDTVPSYWRRCNSVLERLPEDERTALLRNRLRAILTAGDALFGEVPLAWSAFGHPAKLFNFWGQTETAGSASIFRYTAAQVEPEAIVPIGRPLGDTRLSLLDAKLAPVGKDEVGEIYVSSPSVARGYFRDAEGTAERFLLNPEAAGGRQYRTGDLARYRADGVLEYVGRADDQIKVNGFRVHPLDIESALRTHPRVMDVAVASEALDDGLVRLVAYVVAAEAGAALAVEELRRFLEATVPSYMVPASIQFVETIPHLVNGKLDRRGVRESVLIERAAHVETTESKVLGFFRSTLRNAGLTASDDFFQAGGDSLSAIEVMAALSEAFMVRAPTELLFRNSTAGKLAVVLEALPTLHGTQGQAEPGPERAVPVVDLLADTELAARLIVGSCEPVSTEAPRAVLLTGGTGFLGVHLLAELLRQTSAAVFCLVRAANQDAGRAKLEEALRAQRLDSLAAHPRLIPVLGDLTAPGLGLDSMVRARLAREVDTILHCGAFVHYLYGYETLRPTNVASATAVLELASEARQKRVLYMSSIGVLGTDSGSLRASGEPVADPYRLSNGYLQSKWVADRIMVQAQERFPVSVFRPGRITWSRLSGRANPNDVLSRMLTACLALGLAPNMDVMVPMSPVDDLSRIIVQQLGSCAERHVINLPHLTGIRWKGLVSAIRSFGYDLNFVDYGSWLRRVRSATDSGSGSAFGGLSLWLTQDSSPSLGWIDDLESPSSVIGLRHGRGELLDDERARELCEVYLREQVSDGLLEAPVGPARRAAH